MTDTFTFPRLSALVGIRARADAACPECGPQCKTAVNQRRKVLRVWNDGSGFLGYHCVRCGAKGSVKDDRYCPTAAPRPKQEAEPAGDKAELARFLWSRSLPARGTFVEAYLKSRRCFIESPNIRFLPGRNEHPPAMISKFGEGPLMGIHLTKLAADGSGKAGTEKDKIMIGPSAGQPIIVADNPDRGELIVAEGIEDAATLALVTGWSARAAGAAARIPAVVAAAGGFERLYVAFDQDIKARAAIAGRRIFDEAVKARPDLIPVKFGLGKDANKIMLGYGPDAVLAAIEFCEAQAMLRKGQIGSEAMLAAMARANGVFAEMVNS